MNSMDDRLAAAVGRRRLNGQPAAPNRDLLPAITQLYDTLRDLQLPPQLRERLSPDRDRILRHLDGYVMPRLDRPEESPLVVAVGGPTGSGKSTLTNSLLGANVSTSGVLRPTTREPVIAFNANDETAVYDLGLLPDVPPSAIPGTLTGTLREGMAPSVQTTVKALQHPDISPGLVIIDSPDVDSRLERNRILARQLMDVADLWVFVTTGTDYADVLSWEFLDTAIHRNMSVAVVLNRLRDSEFEQVRVHLARLLRDHGLANSPVFALPDMELTQDRLPTRTVTSILRWLEKQAVDQSRKTKHTGQNLQGTLAITLTESRNLADAIAHQAMTSHRYRIDVTSMFSHARETVAEQCRQGLPITEQLLMAWRTLAQTTAAPSRFALIRTPGPEELRLQYRTIVEALLGCTGAAIHQQTELAVLRLAERLGSFYNVRASYGLEDAIDTATRSWLETVNNYQPANPGRVLAIATMAVCPNEFGRDPMTDALMDVLHEYLADPSPMTGQSILSARLELQSRLTSVLSYEEDQIMSQLQAQSGDENDIDAPLRRAIDLVVKIQQTFRSIAA